MDSGSKFVILVCLLWWRVMALNKGCPNTSISPCECSDIFKNDDVKTTISCSGSIVLPDLTSILRESLCGRQIDIFRLYSSEISYLPSNLFYKTKIANIRISFTNISRFTEAGVSAFYGLEKSLKSLTMRKCQLVDGLQWQMIGKLDALVSLDLSENELTTVPQQWFKNPPLNLHSLYLRANRIENISQSAFASMYRLVYLDLSENHISTLARSSFTFPGNSIIFLSLSYNNLTSLPRDFFLEMNGLRRLYVDNNHFETLEEKTWSPIWGEIGTLNLMDNNLKCDCDMQWISKLYPIEHLHGKCGKNTLLKDRELKSLWPWDFDCKATTKANF